MDNKGNGDISKCPFMSGAQKKPAGGGTSNRDWWPNELKLNILRQNATKNDPMGGVTLITPKRLIVSITTNLNRM